MAVTFDKVADIIAETCDIPRETIKPESHAINDLQIDSLDFLDIAFAIDKVFGIKLPLEEGTQKTKTTRRQPISTSCLTTSAKTSTSSSPPRPPPKRPNLCGLNISSSST